MLDGSPSLSGTVVSGRVGNPARVVGLIERGKSMDARLAIAGVYRHLRGHADLIAAFEADLAACQGPEDALNLCDRWLDITIEEPRSGYYEPNVGVRV